jgi:hypothetical protein
MSERTRFFILLTLLALSFALVVIVSTMWHQNLLVQ